jgi:hypothetical protein
MLADFHQIQMPEWVATVTGWVKDGHVEHPVEGKVAWAWLKSGLDAAGGQESMVPHELLGAPNRSQNLQNGLDQ